jgi:hypothetical protein
MMMLIKKLQLKGLMLLRLLRLHFIIEVDAASDHLLPKTEKKLASPGFFGNIIGAPNADRGAAVAKTEASRNKATASPRSG